MPGGELSIRCRQRPIGGDALVGVEIRSECDRSHLQPTWRFAAFLADDVQRVLRIRDGSEHRTLRACAPDGVIGLCDDIRAALHLKTNIQTILTGQPAAATMPRGTGSPRPCASDAVLVSISNTLQVSAALVADRSGHDSVLLATRIRFFYM